MTENLLENKELAEIHELYEANIAPMVPIVYHDIADWLQEVDAAVIKWAIREAAKRNVHQWMYINKIIENHARAGRTTLAAVEDANRSFKARQGQPQSVYDDSGTDYDAIEKLIQEKM